MALVHNEMLCALCRKPIEGLEDGKFFATTYFGIDHPEFRKLDDAAVHGKCIAEWPLRDEFVAYYNKHCCNELKVTRGGDVVYRFSWFDLLTDTPISFVASAFLLPVLGFAEVFGSSTIAIAIAMSIPFVLTISMTCVVTYFYGLLFGIFAAVGTWTLLAFAGDRIIAYEQRRDFPPPAKHETRPCPECGKPLRTALAKQCFECGADWH